MTRTERNYLRLHRKCKNPRFIFKTNINNRKFEEYCT